jgi:hypothetical protein
MGGRQSLLLWLQLRLWLLLKLSEILPAVWSAAGIGAVLGRDWARYYVACARLGLREAAMSSLGRWRSYGRLAVGVASRWQSAATKTAASRGS